MSTHILRAMLALLFISISVTKVSAQETLEQTIARQKAEKTISQTVLEQEIEVSAEEQAIRSRAAEIAQEKQLAEAKKAVASRDTPEQRQARKEIEDARKELRKQEEKLARTIDRAKISGCDPTTMKIHPDAVEHPTINSFVKIRVKNMEKIPVNIEDAKFGLLVENLCPGGSMTIFRNRSLHSPGQTYFRYTASGRFPDGSIGITQSDSYMLTKYDWSSGNGQQERDWFIQLQKR